MLFELREYSFRAVAMLAEDTQLPRTVRVNIFSNIKSMSWLFQDLNCSPLENTSGANLTFRNRASYI